MCVSDEQHCTQNTLAYVADDGAVMLAANCSHLRCADGWQCEQLRLFAKCCRRATDTQSQTESQVDGEPLNIFRKQLFYLQNDIFQPRHMHCMEM
jgi:hypothetical protein